MKTRKALVLEIEAKRRRIAEALKQMKDPATSRIRHEQLRFEIQECARARDHALLDLADLGGLKRR